MSELDPLLAELSRCNKCGFCMTACPTYKATGLEWHVTRGRVSLIQDAQAGILPLAELGDAIDTCLLCNACVGVCPPAIDIGELVTHTRAAMLAEQGGVRGVRRFIYRTLLGRPGVLHAAARLAGAAEYLGLRDLAARSGLLRRWPLLQRAHAVGPRLSGRLARDLIDPRLQPRGPRRARVAYFIGCSKDAVFPRAARATHQVLLMNGVEVVIPRVTCCGLPAHSGGDFAGVRLLARRNLDALERLGAVDAIVCDEGSCTAHLLDYPELLKETPDYDRARRLAAKVQDFAAFLDALGPLPMPRAVNARLTWHDPCSLRHGLKLHEPPRRLLRRVPGATFLEASEAEVCCGGAGAYMLTQPDLSDQVLARKMENLAATAADYYVTASPSCAMQLERGVRERGLGARVLYLSEVLAEAYGVAD